MKNSFEKHTSVLSANVNRSLMGPEQQQEAIDISNVAMQICDSHKEAATYIKKHFDKMYGPSWQCIVGRSFGWSVAHSEDSLIDFSLAYERILIFHCKDP